MELQRPKSKPNASGILIDRVNQRQENVQRLAPRLFILLSKKRLESVLFLNSVHDPCLKLSRLIGILRSAAASRIAWQDRICGFRGFQPAQGFPFIGQNRSGRAWPGSFIGLVTKQSRQYGTTGSRGLQNSVRVFVNKDRDTKAGWSSANRGLTRVVPVPHTNKRRTGHGKRYHVCGNG